MAKETILDQMIAEQAALKASKKSGGKKKFIITVNGSVIAAKLNKKEVAAEVKRLATTDAKVEVFTLTGVATTNLDVTIAGEKV